MPIDDSQAPELESRDPEDLLPPHPDSALDGVEVVPADGTAEPEMASNLEASEPLTASLTVPRARRQIKGAKDEIAGAIHQLANLRHRSGGAAALPSLAIDALVAAALDLMLPLDDDDHRVEDLRRRARAGGCDRYATLAIDELEDAAAALEAATSALKAISMLAEPLPPKWANLPPLLLARELNRLGHTLLRGRIAGVSL